MIPSCIVGLSHSIVAASALVAQRIGSVGMSTYPISNADPGEERRLALLESSNDPGTIQRLSNLGVGPGWRCLEVGAGHGSIAKWLCEKVGTTGSVVAIDIDTRFLSGIAADNLQVLKL